MKIKYLIAIGCLAITANTYAEISTFTGLQKGTSWQEFVNAMEKDTTKRVAFSEAVSGTSKNAAGNTEVDAGLVAGTSALSGAGAVVLTSVVSKLTSTGGAEALTLADGADGQIKVIVHDVDGGSSVLTPTTKTGFSTITFTNAGESAMLVFVTTRGWIIIALNGAVAA